MSGSINNHVREALVTAALFGSVGMVGPPAPPQSASPDRSTAARPSQLPARDGI